MSETPPPTAPQANNVPTPEINTRPRKNWRGRARNGLIVTLVGFLLFLIGARPSLFLLDRSPVIGFVQISVFEVGLAVICLGGYTSLMALWRGEHPSIAAEIGQRLVATGFVIAVFAGMADIFGMGSHPLPGIPYFGPLQALGVEIGQLLIGIGFIMLVPFHKPEPGPVGDEPAHQV
jgi:hypothetical protein